MSWILATGWLSSGYETDTLLEDFFAYAGAETVEDARAVVTKVQDDAIDHAAAVALAQGSYLFAVSPDVSGFATAPFGLHYYDVMSLEG
jgi:peptide/nickel transport system substrate-binding protein